MNFGWINMSTKYCQINLSGGNTRLTVKLRDFSRRNRYKKEIIEFAKHSSSCHCGVLWYQTRWQEVHWSPLKYNDKSISLTSPCSSGQFLVSVLINALLLFFIRRSGGWKYWVLLSSKNRCGQNFPRPELGGKKRSSDQDRRNEIDENWTEPDSQLSTNTILLWLPTQVRHVPLMKIMAPFVNLFPPKMYNFRTDRNVHCISGAMKRLNEQQRYINVGCKEMNQFIEFNQKTFSYLCCILSNCTKDWMLFQGLQEFNSIDLF